MATVGQGWDPFLSLQQQPRSPSMAVLPFPDADQHPDVDGFDTSAHLTQLPSQLQSSSFLVGEDDWSSYNDSQLTPLLPREIVWLMELVEQRIHNKSSLPTQVERAITLARYTSVVYCDPPNILAWNCTRYCTS